MDKCQIINFPKISDERGNLSFIEERKHVPFDIKRIYYMSGVPNGLTRGGHANPKTEHVVIALNGIFKVRIRDKHTEKTFVLDKPDSGLYIPKGIWHQIEDLSQGSIVLVLASTLYDEKDYTRD
jgi:dTDP-4-dehydrorhamnose 3,5-epimerase-like enzyme